MTKDELKNYVADLDDDAEIIVITKEQAGAMPKHSQRIDVAGKIIWVVRMLKKGIWAVVIAWILQTPLDHLPKPDAVVLAAADKIEYVMKHTDFTYPYTTHDQKFSQLAYNYHGATYFTPASALSPDVMAVSGSYVDFKGIKV
jgi:hypothetical protein